MNTKPFSTCGGGSNLILGTGTENQIFFLTTPATKSSSCYQVFSPNCQNMTLWCKKTHYPPRWICMTHIWSPTLFPQGIIIFQGVLTKFNFLMKFPYLEKFASLMKDLKYEHQTIFPLWGRVKFNFRER